MVKDDLPVFREHFKKLTHPDERATAELSLSVKGGGVIQVEIQSVLVTDTRRKPCVTRSTLIDITRRKAAEEAVRNHEARLRGILETAVEGIITIDDRGVITLFNPAAQRMFGFTAAEIIGQNVSLLMPSPNREEHDGYLAHYCKTGEHNVIGIGREVVGQRKDGSTFPLELSVSEVLLPGRRIFTGILRDIT